MGGRWLMNKYKEEVVVAESQADSNRYKYPANVKRDSVHKESRRGGFLWPAIKSYITERPKHRSLAKAQRDYAAPLFFVPALWSSPKI
jgi:hypothetical protein